jgi:hypothetical protein
MEGSGCLAGELGGARRGARGGGEIAQNHGRGVPATGGGGVGAAVGEFIELVEQGADGGLIEPGDELGECEAVVGGHFGEGDLVVQELGDEEVGVDGGLVDVAIDVAGCCDHEVNVAGIGRVARGP